MAIHYVCASAIGVNTGVDWTNAYTSLPATLVRGDTYYIAGGDYSGYTFDTPEDGSSFITLQKATASDHGTDTGWLSYYGSAVAQFNGALVFVTSYWRIDGKVGGGPDSWESGHGIKIQATTSPQYLINLLGPNWWNPPIPGNLEFEHIEVEHMGRYTETNDVGIYSTAPGASRIEENKGTGPANVTIRYCYFHDFGFVPIQTFFAQNWLFEYNHVARNTMSEGGHSEGWQDFGSDDMVIRYNFFRDIEGTAFIALKKNWALSNDNWKIYGNIFCHSYENRSTLDYSVGHGVLSSTIETTSPCTNIMFFNNTIVNVSGWRSGVWFQNGSNNQVYNNLFLECYDYHLGDVDPNVYVGTSAGGVIKGYNGYYKSIMITSVGATEVESEDDPITDWINLDFTLVGNTFQGTPLDSEYAEDMYGNTRGSDGNWDIGAIEYPLVASLRRPRYVYG